MSNGDEEVCATVRGALESQKIDYNEINIQGATKFSARAGVQVASLNVYNSGKLHVEGKKSILNKKLAQIKEIIETGTSGDEKVCATVRGAFESQKIEYNENEIQNATKFVAKAGAHVASLNVYNSGKLHVEGKESGLKKKLTQIKKSIEKSTSGDEKVCATVRGTFESQKIDYNEIEIQDATKFTAKAGMHVASLNVYNSGKLHVEGKDSDLKKMLTQLKEAIDKGAGVPVASLPAEIEKYPQTLREKIPDCDDVILWYFEESLRCYKADSVAGAAFMLGAASEKAILMLIDTYANAIKDEKNKKAFFSRTNNRMISQRFKEFDKSYAGCKSKPIDPVLSQNSMTLLSAAFNFYRHTRNVVGHPHIIPDLDKGVVLANLGMFIVYTERVYALANYFRDNGVEV